MFPHNVQFQKISIYTPPTEGIGISWGKGGSLGPKSLKNYMELNWNFQKGGEVSEKIPSVGEICIFSANTQYVKITFLFSPFNYM